MALPLQRLSDAVAFSLSHVALNPVLTAALLWALTGAPASLQDRLFGRVAVLRDPRAVGQVVKGLKWLFAVGLVRGVNLQLNKLSLNAWRFGDEKKRWDWSQEVAVVTGGSGGIGELVVKKLVRKGIKVAVLDVKPLPEGLQGCMLLCSQAFFLGH